MTAQFDLVTITTPDTERLAAFYAAALGLAEAEREDGDRWIVLAEPDGSAESMAIGRGLDLAHRLTVAQDEFSTPEYRLGVLQDE